MRISALGAHDQSQWHRMFNCFGKLQQPCQNLMASYCSTLSILRRNIDIQDVLRSDYYNQSKYAWSRWQHRKLRQNRRCIKLLGSWDTGHPFPFLYERCLSRPMICITQTPFVCRHRFAIRHNIRERRLGDKCCTHTVIWFATYGVFMFCAFLVIAFFPCNIYMYIRRFDGCLWLSSVECPEMYGRWIRIYPQQGSGHSLAKE